MSALIKKIEKELIAS